MARRATASPAPEGRRFTRSQSRDPQSNKEAARDNDAINDARQIAAGAMAQMGRAAQIGLPSLAEEEDQHDAHTATEHLNDAVPGRVVRATERSHRPDNAPSQFSTMTTFSQEEIAHVKGQLEIIPGALFDLNRISDEILSSALLLNGSEATGDARSPEELAAIVNLLQDRSRKERTSLFRRMQYFNQTIRPFCQQRFIDPQHVLRALLNLAPGDTLGNEVWRPDEILYKANLVTVLDMIFARSDERSIFESISNLDKDFPAKLLASAVMVDEGPVATGESQLLSLSRVLAIELRTQTFIHALQQQRGSSLVLEDILAEYFLRTDQNGLDVFPDELTSSDMRRFDQLLEGPTSAGQDDFYALVMLRTEELRRLLRSCHDNIDRAMSRLQSLHPWTEFCQLVVQWLDLRFEELRTAVQERGGPEFIAETLTDELQKQNLDPSLVTQESLATRENFKRMQQRRQQLQQQQQQQQRQAEASSTAPDPNDPRSHELLMASLLQNNLNDEDPSGRARTLLDRQEGAERLRWDASQQTQETTRRRQRDDSPDPTPDESFGTPPHATSAAPRANMTSSNGGQRRVRPRTSTPMDGYPSTRDVPRRNPGQAMPVLDIPVRADDPPPSPTTQVKLANANARTMTARRRSPTRHRARTPWSDEEVGALLAGMERNGCAWALIKQWDVGTNGNVMANRTAEDLRFKARNLTVDFLKAEMDLPAGFEAVALGKKELEKLEGFGSALDRYQELAGHRSGRSSNVNIVGH